MKNRLTLALCIPLLFFACKLPSYQYVPPTINTTPYSHAGDGFIGGVWGSVGLAAKGGIALSQNINLNGYIGRFPDDGKGGYSSEEGEFSLGVQTNPHRQSVTSFYLGLGNGHNRKDNTGLMGHFNRPFLQIQESSYDQRFISDDVRVDGFLGFRVNYLLYEGENEQAVFDHKLVYYEPYLGGSIGSRNVRFELLQGFAIKNSGEWGLGLRVWPYFGSIGFIVKFGKNRPKRSSAKAGAMAD